MPGIPAWRCPPPPPSPPPSRNPPPPPSPPRPIIWPWPCYQEIPKSNNPKLADLDDDIVLPPPRKCPPPPPSPAPPPPPAPRPPPPPRPSPPPDIIIHPCFEVRHVIPASPIALTPAPAPYQTYPSPANALSLTVTANLRPQHENPGPGQLIREPGDDVLKPASAGRRLNIDIGDPITWRCPPPPSPLPPPQPPRRPSKYSPPMPPVSPPPDCPTPLDFVLVLDESSSMYNDMNGPGGLKAFAKLLVRHYHIPPSRDVIAPDRDSRPHPAEPDPEPPSPSQSQSQRQRQSSSCFTHA